MRWGKELSSGGGEFFTQPFGDLGTIMTLSKLNATISWHSVPYQENICLKCLKDFRKWYSFHYKLHLNIVYLISHVLEMYTLLNFCLLVGIMFATSITQSKSMLGHSDGHAYSIC